MLYRAPIQELKKGGISRRYGYMVVVMQFYPRFLAKELIDEYVHALAPERGLFTEFKAKDRELKNHDGAFDGVRYEERFSLFPDGVEHLERLSAQAKGRDVFLLCQCTATEKCHADLLLLMAKKWFGAPTQFVRREYPAFLARLESGELSPVSST